MRKFTVSLREDGRIELVCSHGVGHTAFEPIPLGYIHGCDGCCDSEEFKKEKRKLRNGIRKK